MLSAQDALKSLDNDNIVWVKLQFTDLNGTLHSVTVPATSIGTNEFKEGIKVDLSDKYKDALLVPDPKTYSLVPWEQNTARFLCYVKSNDSDNDVKSIIDNSEKLYSLGGFDRVELSFDIDFYLFDNANVDKISPENINASSIVSREAYSSNNPLYNFKDASYLSDPYDSFSALRSQMASIIQREFRIEIKEHRHGKDTHGQQRFKVNFLDFLYSADAIQLIKYGVRNIAIMSNIFPTFMPYPIYGERGNSLNFHFSLWKGTKELSESKLTYFLGGLLHHADALASFTIPTTNSFRRVVSNKQYIAWSDKGSVDINKELLRTVVSFYLSDPSLNPYLALPALLAAGVDGIKKKLDPGDKIEDLYSLSSKDMLKYNVRKPPRDIVDAMESLESDNDFLRAIISPGIIANYFEKLLKEHNENKLRPTPYEFSQYFNV